MRVVLFFVLLLWGVADAVVLKRVEDFKHRDTQWLVKKFCNQSNDHYFMRIIDHYDLTARREGCSLRCRLMAIVISVSSQFNLSADVLGGLIISVVRFVGVSRLEQNIARRFIIQVDKLATPRLLVSPPGHFLSTVFSDLSEYAFEVQHILLANDPPVYYSAHDIVNMQTLEGDTALTCILKHTATSTTRQLALHLLSLDADPNSCDASGFTPLIRSCFHDGYSQVVERLLDCKADVMFQTPKWGLNALHATMIHGIVSIDKTASTIRLLLSQSTDILDQRDKTGLSGRSMLLNYWWKSKAIPLLEIITDFSIGQKGGDACLPFVARLICRFPLLSKIFFSSKFVLARARKAMLETMQLAVLFALLIMMPSFLRSVFLRRVEFDFMIAAKKSVCTAGYVAGVIQLVLISLEYIVERLDCHSKRFTIALLVGLVLHRGPQCLKIMGMLFSFFPALAKHILTRDLR